MEFEVLAIFITTMGSKAKLSGPSASALPARRKDRVDPMSRKQSALEKSAEHLQVFGSKPSVRSINAAAVADAHIAGKFECDAVIVDGDAIGPHFPAIWHSSAAALWIGFALPSRNCETR